MNRRRHVLKEETLVEIGERLEHTLQKSLKHLSQETGISVSSVQRATTLLKLHIRIVNIHGLGHKSWQLFYFVDICERITNLYVSCGMSAGIVSTHVVNTLSFRLYMSHFPTGLVLSKKTSCHDFCPNLYTHVCIMRIPV